MKNDKQNTKQLIPKHWQLKKLGEVCTKISLNKIKIKQKDYLAEGKYPVVDQGQELNTEKRINKKQNLIKYIPIWA